MLVKKVNNIHIVIKSYLWDLDKVYGENIYFGIFYSNIYERKQKIIIKPIIEKNIFRNYDYIFILNDLCGIWSKCLVQEASNFE